MQKKWKIISPQIQASEPLDPSHLVELLLHNRGFTTDEDREQFLHPRLEDVTFKNVGIDENEVTKTINRLKKAKKNNEQVIIYGDYDVDGITGSAILWETLNNLGIKTMPYIPHRIDEGYGLSEKGIDNLLVLYPEASLIITVDNGIVANGAVDKAKKLGIDTIITDHHVADEKNHELPASYALVHTTALCGAGVAWLLGHELRRAFKASDESIEDIHLELATLGTVADLVPLTRANRAIVYHGLAKLSSTSRHGLLALYAQAAIMAETIGVYQIGHVIGPRLNASGRLESAMDSLRLLCTTDKNRALELAEKLGLINVERQKVMFEATSDAITRVRGREEIKKVIIIDHDSYPEGVIGLVAGKLVEEFYRPSIVIAKGEKVSKGSVRSIKGVNIIEFLRSSGELFVNIGGHPMAAGFTIKTDKIDELKEILEAKGDEWIEEEVLQRSLSIDTEMSLNDITPELYLSIQSLSPFGMGNAEPTFMSRNVLIREKRIIGKDRKHLRLIFQQNDEGKIFEAIAFGMADRSSELEEESHTDIVYTIDENTWNGSTKLQLKIKDFKNTINQN